MPHITCEEKRALERWKRRDFEDRERRWLMRNMSKFTESGAIDDYISAKLRERQIKVYEQQGLDNKEILKLVKEEFGW